MKSSLARKLAVEFINVLKYNPQLTHDEKILSLEVRLEQLISEVERGAEEARIRAEANKYIVVSETPNEQESLLARLVKHNTGATN